MTMDREVVLATKRTWDRERARGDEVARVTLFVDRGPDLHVRVDAPFHGDPPPASERLWEHEVVELFVAGPGKEYLELEFGPHGDFLALQLDGVRNVVARGLPIEYRAAIGGDRWTAEAVVPAALLPPAPHRFNAYAIHGVTGARRYLCWTPHLGGDRPDFHRLQDFRPLPRPTAGRVPGRDVRWTVLNTRCLGDSDGIISFHDEEDRELVQIWAHNHALGPDDVAFSGDGATAFVRRDGRWVACPIRFPTAPVASAPPPDDAIWPLQ